VAKPLATIRSYQDLHEALRQRVASLDTTFSSLDELAGTADRYCAKLFSPIPMKALGQHSMGPVLIALGCKLLLVLDEEAIQKYAARLEKSKNASGRLLPARKQKNRGQFTTESAVLANARRFLKTSPQRRKKIAKVAARARWSKPRLIEATGTEAVKLRKGAKP
jgi:hypothetical protein